MKNRTIILGDYVIAPVKNAFNNKYSYWISKKGYMYAVYCFTPLDQQDLDWHLTTKEVTNEYIKIFDQMLKQ